MSMNTSCKLRRSSTIKSFSTPLVLNGSTYTPRHCLLMQLTQEPGNWRCDRCRLYRLLLWIAVLYCVFCYKCHCKPSSNQYWVKKKHRVSTILVFHRYVQLLKYTGFAASRSTHPALFLHHFTVSILYVPSQLETDSDVVETTCLKLMLHKAQRTQPLAILLHQWVTVRQSKCQPSWCSHHHSSTFVMVVNTSRLKEPIMRDVSMSTVGSEMYELAIFIDMTIGSTLPNWKRNQQLLWSRCRVVTIVQQERQLIGLKLAEHSR